MTSAYLLHFTVVESVVGVPRHGLYWREPLVDGPIRERHRIVRHCYVVSNIPRPLRTVIMRNPAVAVLWRLTRERCPNLHLHAVRVSPSPPSPHSASLCLTRRRVARAFACDGDDTPRSRVSYVISESRVGILISGSTRRGVSRLTFALFLQLLSVDDETGRGFERAESIERLIIRNCNLIVIFYIDACEL